MASKTSELLNRLPSVSELLEKPPVRALAERWNRSVVAAGVRSFVDELRSDLRRRAVGVDLPSVRELAERAARHVVDQNEPSYRPAINATGQLFGPPWISCPVAETGLERLIALGRDFVVEPTSAGVAGGTAADLSLLVSRITKAQAATAVHSYSGAIWLALAALASNQEVLVSRAEMGDIEHGRPLPPLIASAGAILRDVGATNRTQAADYETAVGPRTAALLKVFPDLYRLVGLTESADLEELVGLARDRELTLIDALGVAPLSEIPQQWGTARRSVQASLTAGVDLVVVRGDGLIGGPPCGVIVGSRELVTRICEHPTYVAWQLDSLRTATLAAALDCHTNAPASEPAIPCWRLLATPLENLRDRAERLAPQLAKAVGIAAATPISTRSQLSVADAPDCGLASYGITLTTATGNVDELSQRLKSGLPPVLARSDGDRLVLDLRTVFPRQDQLLVDSIHGAKQPTAQSQ
jgi:L-seryl-tRNA(Ser) seleniumtransferase